MIDLKSVSWGKLLVAAAMAIIPATLSYCKASDEAATAQSTGRAENEAGYKALVESVRHLEMVVSAQQEALVLLVQRGGVEWGGAGAGSGAGSGSGSVAAGSAAGPYAGTAFAAVEFPALPDSPHDALQMRTSQAAIQADKIEIKTDK